MTEYFIEAGLPAGVLQYFHCGSPSTVESVVRSPKIALVCFTGSVPGGLAVQKAAADRVVNVGLELGGKDPAYVRADVDLAWAADEIVDGAVFNSGQSCCSIERVYVDASVHDAFVAEVQKVLAGYRLGDPFDKATHVGPVISTRSKEAIEAHIADALAKGAKDQTPANETFDNPPSKGNFVKPTLLTGVDHTMRVMTEETFGPVIAVQKVEGDDKAIELMNDSEFGLTASIWTKDTDRGYEIADQVEAGTVFVNRCDFPSPVSDCVFASCFLGCSECVLFFPGKGLLPLSSWCSRCNSWPVWSDCWDLGLPCDLASAVPTGAKVPRWARNAINMRELTVSVAMSRTSPGPGTRTRARARPWADMGLTSLSSPRATTSRTTRNRCASTRRSMQPCRGWKSDEDKSVVAA